MSTRMDFAGQLSVAGKLAEIAPAGKWWAAVPKNEWDIEDEEMMKDIRNHWEDPHGDRRQEIVLIGTDINKEDLNKRLSECLLTDDEYQQGPEEWKKHPDPIHPWEFVEEKEEALVS